MFAVIAPANINQEAKSVFSVFECISLVCSTRERKGQKNDRKSLQNASV